MGRKASTCRAGVGCWYVDGIRTRCGCLNEHSRDREERVREMEKAVCLQSCEQKCCGVRAVARRCLP